MSELAWPFVALVFIGCAAWVTAKFFASQDGMDELRKDIEHLRGMTSNVMSAKEQEILKQVDELKQRISKLEMSRLGRAG
jgi:uncharacterized membrane protein (DUF106 family)